MSEFSVRIAPLSSIPSLLSSLGCCPEEVLDSTGFRLGDFESDENHVPYAEAASLINKSARMSRCDYFGLVIGQRFSLQKLGLVGKLTYTSETVHSALRNLMDSFYLHDSGGIVTLDRTPRLAALSYRSIVPDRLSVVQVNEMCIACLCLIMRNFCGASWNPARVELARPRPASDASYREFFRAPIIFGATKNTISFSNRWLDHPVSSPDYEDHKILVAMAQELLGSASPGLTAVVRRLLHRGLSAGSGASYDISEALGMHERTLRRRLRKENTSFSKLLEEVRQTASFQYLSDTNLSIGDIAGELGYGSTDAFDHAFRRWHGVSPLQWRKLQEARSRSVEAS